MRIGEIGINNYGTKMKIIEYRNCSDIDVQFLDENLFVKKNITYANFIRGEVKNPYDKSVLGIACLGDGIYSTRYKKKTSDIYNTWMNMLIRCYDDTLRWKYPTYENCVVCNEWLNFQNFAKWYNENRYSINEKLHCDKDVLNPGNSVYSPEKCILIPQKINELLKTKTKSNMPIGIYMTKYGKYVATYRGKRIGSFDNIGNAIHAYNIERERVIKEITKTYKDIIPDKIYEALMNYQIPKQ